MTFAIPIWMGCIKGDPITQQYHLEMTGEQLAAILDEYSTFLDKSFSFDAKTQSLIVTSPSRP